MIVSRLFRHVRNISALIRLYWRDPECFEIPEHSYERLERAAKVWSDVLADMRVGGPSTSKILAPAQLREDMKLLADQSLAVARAQNPATYKKYANRVPPTIRSSAVTH